MLIFTFAPLSDEFNQSNLQLRQATTAQGGLRVKVLLEEASMAMLEFDRITFSSQPAAQSLNH